jgi:hypothetical protein
MKLAAAASGQATGASARRRFIVMPILSQKVFRRRLSDRSRLYDPQLGQFLLPYSELQRAASPDALLIDFLQSTYEAAANLAQWDRASLERTNISPAVR